MRLPLQSRTYFVVSLVLHLALFLSLLSSSFRIETTNNTFEATVEFKTPETPSFLTATTGVANLTKQEKSLGSNSSLLSSKSLAPKKLDEILKDRKIKVSTRDDSNEAIVPKKTDLLGYLRANKQTKEFSDVKEKPAKEKGNSVKPIATIDKQDKAVIIPPEKLLPPVAQEAELAPGNLTDQTSDTNQQISAAQRIWQKKNDDQSYRRTLKKLVSTNWIVPPVKVKDFQILIEVVIDKNGNLLKMTQLEGSGLAILDAAAERAIRVSTPFPQMPASLIEEKTEFKKTFRFTPDQVVF